MTDHKHVWDVAAPDGPTSMGICQKCGEEKEMRNSLLMDGRVGLSWLGDERFRLTNRKKKKAPPITGG